MISDNGPQYASDAFAKFAKEYKFCHLTSSPKFPQANGEAERGVETIKEREAVIHIWHFWLTGLHPYVMVTVQRSS